MADKKTDTQGAQASDKAPEFSIQRIYIKDFSLESPHAPAIFLEEWQPEVNLDIENNANKIEDNVYEVVLKLTVTVKSGDKTAFLIEISQAGIFGVDHFPDDQIKPLLGSFCPNVLYPYAREVVTNAAVKAGFPQLYLTPVNFDALYEQHLQSQSGDGEAKH